MPPIIVDTTVNYKIWANSVTVTYFQKTAPAPAPSGVPIPYTLHTLVYIGDSQRPAAKNFRFAKAVASGIIPARGDVIVDNYGIRWQVETIGEDLSFQNEWRVHCTKSTKQTP